MIKIVIQVAADFLQLNYYYSTLSVSPTGESRTINHKVPVGPQIPKRINQVKKRKKTVSIIITLLIKERATSSIG